MSKTSHVVVRVTPELKDACRYAAPGPFSPRQLCQLYGGIQITQITRGKVPHEKGGSDWRYLRKSENEMEYECTTSTSEIDEVGA